MGVPLIGFKTKKSPGINRGNGLLDLGIAEQFAPFEEGESGAVSTLGGSTQLLRQVIRKKVPSKT